MVLLSPELDNAGTYTVVLKRIMYRLNNEDWKHIFCWVMFHVA